MSDKEHSNFLHNALRNTILSDGRRRHTSTTDDMTEVDTEDNAECMARRKGKARMSDIGHISGRSTPESRPTTPPGSSPHHYPPTNGVEGTSGDGSPTIIHAAKVLKHAILHDARNLRRDTSATAGLSSNITSAKEAKVCHSGKNLDFLEFSWYLLSSASLAPYIPA